MTILLFHGDTEQPLTSHKMTKSSYLTLMTPASKNKGTLFSLTLKVDDKNLYLFF